MRRKPQNDSLRRVSGIVINKNSKTSNKGKAEFLSNICFLFHFLIIFQMIFRITACVASWMLFHALGNPRQWIESVSQLSPVAWKDIWVQLQVFNDSRKTCCKVFRLRQQRPVFLGFNAFHEAAVSYLFSSLPLNSSLHVLDCLQSHQRNASNTFSSVQTHEKTSSEIRYFTSTRGVENIPSWSRDDILIWNNSWSSRSLLNLCIQKA